MIKYLILFIILLVPTVAVYGAFPATTTQHNDGDYYYEFNITSLDNYIVKKIFYNVDEYGNKISYDYGVAPWVANIDNWMKSGEISYTEHQYALEYITLYYQVFLNIIITDDGNKLQLQLT